MKQYFPFSFSFPPYENIKKFIEMNLYPYYQRCAGKSEENFTYKFYKEYL